MKLQVRLDTAALDALFVPYDSTHAPGFAVGVSIAGSPVYRRGFGVASVELPMALSPTMRMRIASTSKQFCALAMLLLQEEGKLSIDESPRGLIPELPAWADGMTIRQLLAHTSGMRDSLDLMMLSGLPANPVSADAQFDLLFGLDSTNFPPGTSWNYNNSAYALLSRIVERASGMAFGHFLETKIFQPIGMADTALRPLDTTLLPNSAALHLPDGHGGWLRGGMGVPVAGEGGIVSTVDDMLRWLRHMDDPIVGSAASWSAIRAPVASNGYGLGLIIGEYRGLRTVHHAGGVPGGGCQMIKVVDAGLDIILITNGRNTLDLYELVDAIIDGCIPDLPPESDITGAMFEGTFHSRDSGRVLTVTQHEGQPWMAVQGMLLPMIRHNEGALGVKIMPTDLRAQPVLDGGEIIALDVTEFGAQDRLEIVTPSGETAAAISGSYHHKPARMTARIADGVLSLSGPEHSLDYGLRPLGPGLWEAVAGGMLPVWATLEFDADGFLLTSGRTIRLRFTAER